MYASSSRLHPGTAQVKVSMMIINNQDHVSVSQPCRLCDRGSSYAPTANFQLTTTMRRVPLSTVTSRSEAYRPYDGHAPSVHVQIANYSAGLPVNEVWQECPDNYGTTASKFRSFRSFTSVIDLHLILGADYRCSYTYSLLLLLHP